VNALSNSAIYYTELAKTDIGFNHVIDFLLFTFYLCSATDAAKYQSIELKSRTFLDQACVIS